MDAAFILTKLALMNLQEMGYREVWIGRVPNPHWDHDCDNFVIAAPKCRLWNDPAVWHGSERVFGKMGCGNGLREADQCQRENVRNMMRGHYVFRDGTWFPESSGNLG